MKRGHYILFAAVIISVVNSCDAVSTKKESMKEMGRYLFFDTHLSLNNTKSCASCHDPLLAFTDGYRVSTSSLGENLMHNSPSLLNASQLQFLDWANPDATNLNQQIKRPLYHKAPIELGLDLHWDKFKLYLKSSKIYRPILDRVLSNDSLTMPMIENAIVAFTSSINSQRSLYDQYTNGDSTALGEAEKRGLKLFMSKRLNCASCHMPHSFTLATTSKNIRAVYTNIGLAPSVNPAKLKKSDWGLYENTKRIEDLGKFRIPSLRNVVLTPPYMHSGQFGNLKDVLQHYKNGGQGFSNNEIPNKDKRIVGFDISEQDQNDIISFLVALTDTSYLSDDKFRNPFTETK